MPKLTQLERLDLLVHDDETVMWCDNRPFALIVACNGGFHAWIGLVDGKAIRKDNWSKCPRNGEHKDVRW